MGEAYNPLKWMQDATDFKAGRRIPPLWTPDSTFPKLDAKIWNLHAESFKMRGQTSKSIQYKVMNKNAKPSQNKG